MLRRPLILQRTQWQTQWHFLGCLMHEGHTFVHTAALTLHCGAFPMVLAAIWSDDQVAGTLLQNLLLASHHATEALVFGVSHEFMRL